MLSFYENEMTQKRCDVELKRNQECSQHSCYANWFFSLSVVSVDRSEGGVPSSSSAQGELICLSYGVRTTASVQVETVPLLRN